jgi:UDP-N-acetylglucosamine diphosphorylase / glucose-1-phosphate thymidylyltransferase / UDP-N-acetylgalactosamine diphosphorylase / glucosamine-1-phosphate N-acetyltransferase / galactosamine-1-phosphate N-acetyltransferase
MNGTEQDGWPLTLTRSMADFPVANVPLKAWAAEPGSELAERIAECRFPWDLLEISEMILGAMESDEIEGEIHASAVIEGRLRLGKGSRVLPGVFIEGNVVIGENCKIGPNCYVRGNTSIGDGCHIGQSVEIKNCIILAGTNVGHLSYVGDSILGEGVNFGAGTMVSNFRHDGGNHRSEAGGRLVDTGRRKFGTIIGDGVHTGIGTLVYPGRKIWPRMSTRPGEVVERDLRPVE